MVLLEGGRGGRSGEDEKRKEICRDGGRGRGGGGKKKKKKKKNFDSHLLVAAMEVPGEGLGQGREKRKKGRKGKKKRKKEKKEKERKKMKRKKNFHLTNTQIFTKVFLQLL